MTDHNATDSMSRRNVLKATGGLLAGSTMLAGLGAGRGATTEEGLQFEVEEATEEVIIAVADNVPIGTGAYSPREVDVDLAFHLGHVDQFVIREDRVSLPEDTERLAQPVEVERLDEQTYRMYFRTGDSPNGRAFDWPKEYEGEEITLGLGIFPERTVPRHYWGTDTVPGWRSDE